jgi:predicted Kef-type K+ transport protein
VVLAIATKIACMSARLFDVSFAVDTFFAGLVLAEFDLSERVVPGSPPRQTSDTAAC